MENTMIFRNQSLCLNRRNALQIIGANHCAAANLQIQKHEMGIGFCNDVLWRVFTETGVSPQKHRNLKRRSPQRS